MLDNTTIDYILNYYSRFMTLKEAAAMKHYTTLYKFPKETSGDGKTKNLFLEKGWLSSDKEVLDLLKDGYKRFRQNTAERILKHHAANIYFNHCPKCGQLARTPQAKQCRYCGYRWHKQIVATFQIASAFELTARELFFALGDILTGNIKIGMKADLTVLGLAVKPTITAIEFARHNDDGIVWEDIGLGFTGLSGEDKEFLKTKSPFMTPIFIEDENAS
jgi:ribosomal protein L40E